MAVIINNDTGSLKVGSSLGELQVGDSIQLKGEKGPRKISYLMGKGDKCHACCKGFGPFPTGEVEVEKVQ